MNKGKIKPLDLMMRSSVYTKAFSKLCELGQVEDATISTIESFVCALYGKPNLTSVDDVRYTLFQQHYAPKSTNDPLDRIKGANPSTMPPCRTVLLQKICRSHLVTLTWKNANHATPCTLNPEENGWILVDGSYSIN